MGIIFSCIPYKSIDFQILRPAHIKLGNNIDKVDIHCEYCINRKAISFLDSVEQIEARVSLNFLYTLKENLEKSPIFQNTKFSLISSDSLLLKMKDHNSRKNNGLYILLDSIYLKDTILIEREKYRYLYSYTFAIAHKFGCRTYNMSDLQILDNHLMEDTVFWPSQPSEWELLMNNPTILEAMWDTGIKAGEKYAHYLAPYWVEQSRDFYFGNDKAFKKSYTLIQINQLDSALNILQQGNNKKPGKNKLSKLLYNSAIIYELKDDFENAQIMADSSYRLVKNIATKYYADKLRIRKLDKIALDWQLN